MKSVEVHQYTGPSKYCKHHLSNKIFHKSDKKWLNFEDS